MTRLKLQILVKQQQSGFCYVVRIPCGQDSAMILEKSFFFTMPSKISCVLFGSLWHARKYGSYSRPITYRSLYYRSINDSKSNVLALGTVNAFPKIDSFYCIAQSCEHMNKQELEYQCEWRYNSCGPACSATCQHLEPVECPLRCVEGCHVHCPPGKPTFFFKQSVGITISSHHSVVSLYSLPFSALRTWRQGMGKV